MTVLVQIDFHYAGPYGAQMSANFRELAESIANEPGLLWKIWTENEACQEAGGVYLFADDASAQAYLDKHEPRLVSAGVTRLNVKKFQINTPLTHITKGPVR